MHIAIISASSLSFSYISEPHILMREAPSQDATVCSDAVYSERIEIVEEQGDWAKIKTVIDGYEGWIKKEIYNEAGVKRTVYHTRKEAFLENPGSIEARVRRSYMAHLYAIADTEKGSILDLPFESRMLVLDQSDARWIKVQLLDGRQAYVQRGDVTLHPKPVSLMDMCLLSLEFMGLPYTWGGRSSVGGFDCSGFVQMLFRQMNVHIPRDTKDQLKWEGFIPVEMHALQRGDLIYFGLAEDKIRHTGLYLGEGCFIHSGASQGNMPYVRISQLTDSDWDGSGKFVFRAARRFETASKVTTTLGVDQK